jgi:hypothetical protein
VLRRPTGMELGMGVGVTRITDGWVSVFAVRLEEREPGLAETRVPFAKLPPHPGGRSQPHTLGIVAVRLSLEGAEGDVCNLPFKRVVRTVLDIPKEPVGRIAGRFSPGRVTAWSPSAVQPASNDRAGRPRPASCIQTLRA